MKLVLIHGRSQGGMDPIVLQQEWEDALNQGLTGAGLKRPVGVDVALPFYGDKLDHWVEEVSADLLKDVSTKGAAPDTEEADFRAELLYELAQGAGITDDDIAADPRGDVLQKGPQNWEFVHALLKALDKTPLGTAAIDAFTRDVYVYLTYGVVRREIDDLVKAEVSSPCVVLAHSLGTVVGYNVLRHSDASVDVKGYITVGSPLGIRAIKKKLARPIKMPECTRSWYNAMDERDVVALHPLDARNFPTDPSIVNKTTVDNFTTNRHGISGYLSDPDIARAIHTALTG